MRKLACKFECEFGRMFHLKVQWMKSVSSSFPLCCSYEVCFCSVASQITQLSLGVSPRYTLSSPALEKEVWPLFAKVTESVFIAAVFFPGTGSKYRVVIRHVWWNQLHITSTLCQVFYKLTQKGPLFAWMSSKAFFTSIFF